jgi:hypothetical protein
MFLQAALCHCLRNCGQGQTYSTYTVPRFAHDVNHANMDS